MRHWIRIIVWALVAGCALGVGAQVWVFVTGDTEVFDSKYGAGLPVVVSL
ncbi:MAG: hypothetical protein HY319_25800 [Armatimonadetes bacterium]|nr:hypothetical protein [Armatimonadota bacterium]